MLVILLDVRQFAARQYVLLTKASSSKPQAPSSKPQAPSVRQYVALTQDVGMWPATICHIDTRYRECGLRQYVTLTQDIGVRQFGN